MRASYLWKIHRNSADEVIPRRNAVQSHPRANFPPHTWRP
jgi:hypothetical protein